MQGGLLRPSLSWHGWFPRGNPRSGQYGKALGIGAPGGILPKPHAEAAQYLYGIAGYVRTCMVLTHRRRFTWVNDADRLEDLGTTLPTRRARGVRNRPF